MTTTDSLSAVFDALPGLETSVDKVQHALATIWDVETDPDTGSASPTEFRASQMNLVLHFGLETTPTQARTGFETAIQFSRRYPCRIIALCPREEGRGGDILAKVFCECFVGASQHERTCTEAIILTYPLEQRAYLEDQASIMLESDLPLFYWPQYIQRASRMLDYQRFLKSSQRIVLDSATEKPDLLNFAWPRPEILHDLAWGRILPLRQNMGHFLSYVTPERLVRGLRAIEIRHQPSFAAEARAVERWTRHGLDGCYARAGDTSNRAVDERAKVTLRTETKLEESIRVTWTYATDGGLNFAFDLDGGTATLESTLDCEPNRVTSSIRLLPPDRALAEVLFF